MRFHQLAQLFYDWGWEIKHDHYVAFSDYLKDMLKMNRVMVLMNGEEIEAIIMFYLTDDYTQIYKKQTWDLAKDNPNGSQIYIDKMVCKKVTREVIRKIQDAIEEKYPQVELGVYHRAPFDRCIKIRRKHELQHTVS